MAGFLWHPALARRLADDFPGRPRAWPFPQGSAPPSMSTNSPRPASKPCVKPVIEFIPGHPLGGAWLHRHPGLRQRPAGSLATRTRCHGCPGFPIEERLNIFTAGCLLALMSIPTIFSLAEDALNNVPSAYAEASDALGASRIQTTFRVVIPAAFSGILAAVLLGLGRVIGETMVVLLVAGNRIKIPDFSAGLGAFLPTLPHAHRHHRPGTRRSPARQRPLPRAVCGGHPALRHRARHQRHRPPVSSTADPTLTFIRPCTIPDKLIRKGLPKGHFKDIVVRAAARRHHLSDRR